jgi:dTDP-4-dehydrorhamnose 3,5-epimerase
MKYVKNIIKHSISGLLEIELDPFHDKRGEIWSIYEKCELFPDFVEDKVTISNRGVLRGLHGDYETDKLITCLHGELFLAVVDIRKNSPEYKKVTTFKLSEENPKMILVPSGCLNGHLCISDKCIFFYKWSKKYTSPDDQITIKWDDSDLNINWPINYPILSDRDSNAKNLRDFKL